ncbi:MAG: hypothetical protein ACREBG_05600 [Pyrinomonadaceae bacterium]
MLRKIILAILTLSVLSADGILAAPKKPPREVFGLRIGMSEESVHRRLRRIATQQKEEKSEEEEGEQEVWILKGDARFNYLLTRFNREHRLVLITVVAHPNRVRYADVASIKEATVATDGSNYSYKWKVEGRGQRKGSLYIARGSSPEFLTSYSLYLVR